MSSKEPAASVDSLPVELLCMVLAHLDPPSLQQAGGVCKYWRRIVTDDRSWRRAYVRTFGRLPFERLSPSRMPSTQPGGDLWLDRPRAHSCSWRQEYVSRLLLDRMWLGQDGFRQKRLDFNVRASSIDRLIVCEKHGWALAVSKAGRAAVKCLPRTGKVFARDAETKDIIFALPRDDSEIAPPADAVGAARDWHRVTALKTRIDRIYWGLGDSTSAVTHLTKYGGLLKRVVLPNSQQRVPILDLAGPLDGLAQDLPEWRAAHGVATSDDLVASASANGSVYLWSGETGQLLRVLRGVANVPLVKVTWAEGARYVVAATAIGVVFAWNLALLPDLATTAAIAPTIHELFASAPWLAPDTSEYEDGLVPPTFVYAIPGILPHSKHLILQLIGDPFSDSFVIVTETSGVYRMTVSGLTTKFAPGLPLDDLAMVTAAHWRVSAGTKQRRVPGFSQAPTRTNSEIRLNAPGKREDNAADSDPHVLRLELSKSPILARHPTEAESATRLLVVGDAAGSVWVYDADCQDADVRPVLCWPRLHRCAVSAVTINAGVLVSAARDGQMFVLSPVSAQMLGLLRCHGGGRAERRNLRRRGRANNNAPGGAARDAANAHDDNAARRLDPWFWSVHGAIMNSDSWNDIHVAQLLASRTSAQWEQQVAGRTVDALDRVTENAAVDDVSHMFRRAQVQPLLNPGFPTLVSDVAAGYGWLVIANGTRIQSCFLEAHGRHHHHHHRSQHRKKSTHSHFVPSLRCALEEDLAHMKLETQRERQRRIELHESRTYVEREFVEPSSELGLNPDEQLAYALWLSSQQQSSATPGGYTTSCSASTSDLCDSSIASTPVPASLCLPDEDAASASHSAHFALEGMTEDEQLEYALFLSKSST